MGRVKTFFTRPFQMEAFFGTWTVDSSFLYQENMV